MPFLMLCSMTLLNLLLTSEIPQEERRGEGGWGGGGGGGRGREGEKEGGQGK